MKNVQFGKKLVAPSKIACIGRNYVEHIRELDHEVSDNLVVFLKPNSSIGTELYAFHLEPLSYEAELSFLCEGNRFVAVAVGLDITKRTLQKTIIEKGLPWERCKAFHNAALFSEFVPIEEIGDDLLVELSINGTVVQRGGVDLMINKPARILEELSTFMEMEDGDIVMTGTPKGVGLIKSGDVFVGKVLRGGKTLAEATWVAK